MFQLVRVGLAVGALHACLAAGPVAPEELTASDAVRLALENRAELSAADEAHTVSAGLLRQAGLSPNPVLSVQTENWRFWGDPALSGTRDLDLFALITQRIETGGKRRARTKLAEADQRASALQREALEWAIRAQVRRAFLAAQAARARRDLRAKRTAIYEELERYQQVRVEQGAAAEIDLLKVKIERQKAAADLARDEIAADQALLALLAAMSVGQPASGVRLIEERPLSVEPPPADLEAWKNAAVESHPDVRLARLEAERAAAAIGVERAVAKPDVTPYFGYKRDGPFHSLVGGVSIPLALRNRNQGSIEAATAEERRRRALVRAAETRVVARVTAAARAWERQAELARSITEDTARQALEAREIAMAAYREQGVDLLFLLDAQRTETEVALLAAQAITQYRSSRLDFETAVGRPIEGERR